MSHLPLGGTDDLRRLPSLLVLAGTLCPSPSLSSTTGLRSLIVKHTVHLKTCNSFGHLTIESQVMHFPVFKSWSGTFDFAGEDESSSVDSRPIPPFALFCFFFKNRGMKGWLMERPWLAVLEGFVEADAP